MQLAQAKAIADNLVSLFTPYCERCEIAGGIRRLKPEPHDIEIVAIPKSAPDMFGDPVPGSLSTPLLKLLEQGAIPIKLGLRMKQFKLPEGINLDLFLVLPPAQWGVIYTIRTGPGSTDNNFSQWIVTPRNKGGALPSWAHVKDGAVRKDDDTILPMPEEQDFLDFLGLGWIEPKDRVARWRQAR